ncbi:amino acid adenylation domain-containing protein, partial [Deltaproteobacteria bacterium TL4]
MWERAICFISTAHTDQDVEQIIHAIKETMLELKKAFFFSTLTKPLIRIENDSDPRPAQPGITKKLPSSVQRRMYILQQLEGEQSSYQLTVTWMVEGVFDLLRWENSLKALIQRHESLRSSFVMEGEQLFRHVQDSVDFSICLKDGKESGLDEQILEMLQTYQLDQAPLLRVSVLRLAPQKHLMVLNAHHIIMDGLGGNAFLQELITLYQALPLLPLKRSYTDFVQWESTQTFSEHSAYWKNRLSGDLPLINWPSDWARPAQRTVEGGTIHEVLSKEEVQQFRQFAKQQGVTVNVMLLALYNVFLYKLTSQHEFIIGIPVSGRPSGFDRVVGMFLNSLPLRYKLDPEQNFEEFLQVVKRQTFTDYAHQACPFDRMLESLNLERDTSRNPVFDTMLLYEHSDARVFHLPDLKLEFYPAPKQWVTHDLTLEVMEQEGVFQLDFQYSKTLFKAETIQRWMRYLKNLLGTLPLISKQPLWQIELMLPQEKQQLLVEWNQTQAAYPKDRTAHSLFSEQAAATPEGIALVFEGKTLTYRELDEKTNQLAHYLQQLGVVPETIVGLCVERSLDMIIGVLGIVKAGGAYLPLDSKNPKDRLAFMMEDTNTPVLLTQSHLRDQLPAHSAKTVLLDKDWEQINTCSVQAPNVPVTSQNLVYVIYTSGSTGRPKGVMLQHRNLCNLIKDPTSLFMVKPGARVAQFLSFSFDVATGEIWLTLAYGGTLYLGSSETMIPGNNLITFLKQNKISHLMMVPSALAVMPDADLPDLKTLLVIGEACPAELPQRWAQNLCFINAYGPTETTIWSTMAKVEKGHEKPPVGVPIANTQIYILDSKTRPTPIGVFGELYIGGEGVARGYLNRPELNAERFIQDPFSKDPEARIYRTGDLARWLADGNLDFLGRVDHQVKLRGFRIELGEIESVLRQHPLMRQAVAVVRPDRSGQGQLVVYLVTSFPVENATLQNFMSAKLPEYMVPSLFVFLDAMPTLSNGKINRKALPEPNFDGKQESYIAPSTPTEELLVKIWKEVLGSERLGVTDNFFEHGGHSLKGVQVVSRMNSVFGGNWNIRTLFDQPTIASLAKLVDQQQTGPAALPPLVPVSREQERISLAPAQQRLWFLEQLDEPGALYNIPGAVSLKGPLKLKPLESAINEIVRRQESLRTVFITDELGHPYQKILKHQLYNLEVVDLSALPQHVQDAQLQYHLQAESQKPFVLDQAPLFRAVLFCLEQGEEKAKQVLFLNMHHIISDAWSIDVFLKELSALYTAFVHGEASPLPELKIQYADFSQWQRQWLKGDLLKQQLEYWQRQLAHYPGLLELPTDRPRPAAQSFKGSVETLLLSAELTQALNALSRQVDASLFTTLLTAWTLLMARYSRQEALVIGVPVTYRQHRDLEPLIGFFVNMLPLGVELSPSDSFFKLLNQVKQRLLSAYEHQDLPFEQLVEHLNVERTLSHSPLFQVVFTLQYAVEKYIQLADLQAERVAVPIKQSKFDLVVLVEEKEDTLEALVEYSTALFDAETIQRMLGHYQELLESILRGIEQPVSQLSILPKAELQKVYGKGMTPEVNFPKSHCLHQLFEEQVHRTPDKSALFYKGQSLSYQELNNRANQLAQHLIKQGVQFDVPVGLYLEPSFEMILSILAVLKAGGGYVPLDPKYPRDRIDFMLQDAQLTFVLTQQKLGSALPVGSYQAVYVDLERWDYAEESEANPKLQSHPSHLAYIIYTSGSTGKPKGVMIEHRHVVRLMFNDQNPFDFSSADIWT